MDTQSQNLGEAKVENRYNDGGIKKENVTENKQRSESSFSKLCAETTLHGIKYIFDFDASRTRRFIWTWIFLGQFISFVVLISLSFAKYLEFEVSRKITVVHETQLDFPQVTICNYNQFRKSVIAGTALEEYLFQLLIVEPLGLYDQYPLSYQNLSQADINGDEYNRIIGAAAHNLSDFLLDCTWLDYYVCDERNFTKVATDFGLCYTFTTREVAKHTGFWNGLKLRLSVEEDEYTYNFIGGVGFKILLHPPNEIPLVGENGFTITPGLAATVAMELQEERSLPSPYKNKCGSKSLKYFDEYNIANCKMELITDLAIETCGCKVFYMPEKANATACSMVSYLCILDLDIPSTSEFCPLPCSTFRYIPSVTYANFPDKSTAKYMAMKYNRTEEYARQNYVEGTIFFKTLRYERTEEVSSYSGGDLGAYIGGQMGLTIGASLLTLYEWFDWMVTASVRKWKARKERKIAWK